MTKNMTFEAAMDRLDQIVLALESPNTPLDDSLKLFSEGAELLAYCNTKLSKAKQQVEKLFPKLETDQEEANYEGD